LDLASYGVGSLFEGREPFTVHALRRTFLTMLTDAAVSDGDVKLLAGHAAPGVTRGHYVAATLERLRKAVISIPVTESQEAAA